MTVSSFCESRNGPYTNFRHAITTKATTAVHTANWKIDFLMREFIAAPLLRSTCANAPLPSHVSCMITHASPLFSRAGYCAQRLIGFAEREVFL